MSQTAAKRTKTTQTFEPIKKPETPKDYDLIKLKYDNAKYNIKLLEGYKASLKKYPNSEHKEKWIARITELEKITQESEKTVQELENVVLTYEKSLSAYNNQLANYTKLYPKAGKTVQELSQNGYTEFSEVKGAIKAVQTKFGKKSISYINPQNGTIVKTVRQGHSSQVVAKLQKDGSYIHEATCNSFPGETTVKYKGYSLEGEPLPSSQKSMEITIFDGNTGKTTTYLLDEAAINRGLAQGRRFKDRLSSFNGDKVVQYATGIPTQDTAAMNFLSPKGNLSTWGTPDIYDIKHICQL